MDSLTEVSASPLPEGETLAIESDTGAFALLPEWVLDSGVSDRAIRLYCILARYADKDTGESFYRRSKVAERMRCSVDSLDRATKELVKVGALSVSARKRDDGGQSSNLYTVARVRPPRRTGAAPPAAAVRPISRVIDPESENKKANGSNGVSPSLPGVTAPLAKEQEPDYGFEKFWGNYPARRGVKVGRREALAQWRKLKLDDKRAANKGACYLSDAVAADKTLPADAHRFLRDRRWEDWQEPPIVEGVFVTAGGTEVHTYGE